MSDSVFISLIWRARSFGIELFILDGSYRTLCLNSTLPHFHQRSNEN
jgi:hypothetical protein